MKIKISFKEANQLLDIRDERAKETDTLRGLQLFILALFCGFMALLPLKKFYSYNNLPYSNYSNKLYLLLYFEV